MSALPLQSPFPIPSSTAALTADQQELLEDALHGLSADRKTLPCKYFYDAVGSKLFDRITELDAYYLTRTEVGIMEEAIESIVDTLGSDIVLVEYGSGSSHKTRLLLDHLHEPAAYVPVDISRKHLLETAEQLRTIYPDVPIYPVAADYTADFELPPIAAHHRTVVYFPGSTLGNFNRTEARAFLEHIAEVVGSCGGLLIGIDLKKDRARLEAAYDDPQGVTAAFNKNLLRRLNRDVDATFDLDQFEHRAFYNEEEGRIEMHLISRTRQVVDLGDARISFEKGETIWTESSYKYSLPEFASLADEAGFDVDHVWTDADALFSVQYLTAR